MGRSRLALTLLVACSDPAAQPDAGVDAAEPDTLMAALSIAPASFDYGELALDGAFPPPRLFTITNLTPAPIDVASIAVTGLHPEDFAIATNTCGPTLDASASCTVTVMFAPTGANQREALLEVVGPTSASAYLQGTANVQSRRLFITPPARDFGDVGVGETGAPQTFKVLNEAIQHR